MHALGGFSVQSKQKRGSKHAHHLAANVKSGCTNWQAAAYFDRAPLVVLNEQSTPMASALYTVEAEAAPERGEGGTHE